MPSRDVARSAHHHTGVEEYGLVSEEECLRQAQMNEHQGVSRFSLVTSGRRPSAGELEKLCAHFEYVRAHSSIKLCASLGLATEEQLAALHRAGVSRYHWLAGWAWTCAAEASSAWEKHLPSGWNWR